MKSFKDYVQHREAYSADAMSVSPPVGSGMAAGNKTDSRTALKDLLPSIDNMLAGPTGPKALTAMVNGILGEPTVPERFKQEIRARVAGRWAHLVNLNELPASPTVGNSAGQAGYQGLNDPSMNNVVIPNRVDQA